MDFMGKSARYKIVNFFHYSISLTIEVFCLFHSLCRSEDAILEIGS